jgi:hypothetical protein
MVDGTMSILANDGVKAELRRAWQESEPGTARAHEEGGFVLRQTDGSFSVERWPRGAQDEIELPQHPGGHRDSAVIVATFHTHPNTGPDFLQEPGPTDIRGVTEDPDLRHEEYEGEYVISRNTLYLIRPDGSVEALGDTNRLLSAGES